MARPLRLSCPRPEHLYGNQRLQSLPCVETSALGPIVCGSKPKVFLEGGEYGLVRLMPPTTRAVRSNAIELYSRSLRELVARDSVAASLLEEDLRLPSRSACYDIMRGAHSRGGWPSLREEKRRRLLVIAARDLAGELSLEEVGGALTGLTDACLQVSLEALKARHLSVIAMGKLGGEELNYASDIDLMFVSNAQPASAARVVEALLQELGTFSPQGQAYRIDCNLRPEGRNGPLVRSLDGYLKYYARWAKSWEYQALLKARASAGDMQLAQSFIERTRAFAFSSEVSQERIAGVRKMKERVESHAADSARRRKSTETDDVKLGPGGIRDIEFSIQLLQLVHGGSDPSVRAPGTLAALNALVAGGYVAEDDGAGLSVAYRWLRNVEHRCQLWQERQVHTLPAGGEARARIARAMGFKDSPLASALERFEQAHGSILADVRSRFERLFYRPMVESLADPSGPRLSVDALKERLRVLGFRDADRAALTLGGLVAGSSRRAKLFRVLTPALLRWLASAPQPDEGLFAFLRLGERLEERLDMLGALRDNPPGLALLARVLGSGRVLGEILAAAPDELATIAAPRGPGTPKGRERLVREAVASLQWREPEGRLDGLRRFKRREMLRIAVADIAGEADVQEVGTGIAGIADACLEAALSECKLPFVVIGMGKLGGRELHYASDIDVMLVHDCATEEAERIGNELRRAISEVTPEGQTFKLDLGLRPEGKSGPIVRSLDSYLEYYARWAKPWEHQALLKARVAAGDHALGLRFMDQTRSLAYPARLPPGALAQIRHLKARMERERIPRGTDARRNLKMGPGGIADVEFAVQLLQLQHAHRHDSLRVTNTLQALGAALDCDLLTVDEHRRLHDSYVLLTRIRNRCFFFTGRATQALPTLPEELESLGVALGFREQPRQELEESYLRVTRRARVAAERLIYG